MLPLTVCARQLPANAVVVPSELDVRTYGAPQAPFYDMRQVDARGVPVAAELEGGRYTLDSGDKIRIVVFGRDTLQQLHRRCAGRRNVAADRRSRGARPD